MHGHSNIKFTKIFASIALGWYLSRTNAYETGLQNSLFYPVTEAQLSSEKSRAFNRKRIRWKQFNVPLVSTTALSKTFWFRNFYLHSFFYIFLPFAVLLTHLACSSFTHRHAHFPVPTDILPLRVFYLEILCMLVLLTFLLHHKNHLIDNLIISLSHYITLSSACISSFLSLSSP